jgi:hypothetical protein
MLTRSYFKKANQNSIAIRSTRTHYYLRNLPIINYFEADEDNNDSYEDDNLLDNIEICAGYIPGPYDDIDSCYGYCYYAGYYDGYDGYDN